MTEPTNDQKYMRNYKSASPDLLKAYADFSGAVFAEEGRTIPKKYRELMAVTAGITIQCPYCIDAHTKAALKAGATEEEVAEAIWVSSAVRAGGSYTHGRLAFRHTDGHEGHPH